MRVFALKNNTDNKLNNSAVDNVSTPSRMEALRTLRLPLECSERSEIDAAFRCMAQRYPAEVFPERYGSLRLAYETLTHTDKSFRNLLVDERVDLAFLRRALILEKLAPDVRSEGVSHLVRDLLRHELKACSTKFR